MTAERRAAMGQAAVEAAKAVGYVGAGTVEFIAHPDGRFYFMEMNTRLQVEHPGDRDDHRPRPGRVAAARRFGRAAAAAHRHSWRSTATRSRRASTPRIPIAASCRRPASWSTSRRRPRATAVRVDTGVEEGDSITPFYDPMIAKLIVHAADRAGALARMRAALAQYRIVGVANNVEFLGRLDRDAFVRRRRSRHGADRARARRALPGGGAAGRRRLACRRAGRGRARPRRGARRERAARARARVAMARPRRLAPERPGGAPARLSRRRDDARGRRRGAAGRPLGAVARRRASLSPRLELARQRT